MKTKIGIITADIIDSTDISIAERDAVFEQFTIGLEEIKSNFSIVYEWYRGDAFQIKVNNFNESVQVALLIKFWIKSIEKVSKKAQDVRLSVAIGTVEVNKKELSLSDGEAFRLSGRNLDQLKPTKQSFIVDSNDWNSSHLQIQSVLLNTIMESITPIQSKVLYYKLYGFTEDAIAKQIGLAQSTVNQHANAGNWSSFSKYLDYFKKIYDGTI